jgi:hypothetical protein
VEIAEFLLSTSKYTVYPYVDVYILGLDLGFRSPNRVGGGGGGGGGWGREGGGGGVGGGGVGQRLATVSCGARSAWSTCEVRSELLISAWLSGYFGMNSAVLNWTEPD